MRGARDSETEELSGSGGKKDNQDNGATALPLNNRVSRESSLETITY